MKSNRPDVYNLVAADRGCPPGWLWYSLKAIGENREQGAVLVKGAVCTTMFKSGPRKGTPNWSRSEPGTDREILVTFADLDARERRWESDTGKCAKCGGDGHEAVGFSSSGTRETRPCARCDATGVIPSGGEDRR